MTGNYSIGLPLGIHGDAVAGKGSCLYTSINNLQITKRHYYYLCCSMREVLDIHTGGAAGWNTG